MHPLKWIGVVAFAAASGAQAQQSVILVRHAELLDAPGVDAKQIGLSDAGTARAQRLAQMLGSSKVGAVYCTDFLRTHDTALPTARAAGYEVTVASQNDASEFVARLKREHAQDVVLVVGHTDTLPAIAKALGADDVRIDKTDFGNIFVVTPRAGSAPALLRLRY